MSKLKKYLFLTFSITFLSWGMIAVYTQIKNIPFGSSIALYILYILGVIGPAIAGITVSKRSDSKEDFSMFLKSCYQPPKHLNWYFYYRDRFSFFFTSVFRSRRRTNCTPSIYTFTNSYFYLNWRFRGNWMAGVYASRIDKKNTCFNKHITRKYCLDFFAFAIVFHNWNLSI
ncbi:hypothetical protein MKX49_21515 [Peribacillus sp. FSL M8-0224]|uniref:hypothetical protein n=1 Tax=Peribacillus sp. FSL M8-0224 TaxID=2921568 RepID=UPI0030FAC6C0